jgi:hypothetical protein
MSKSVYKYYVLITVKPLEHQGHMLQNRSVKSELFNIFNLKRIYLPLHE